MLKYTWIFGIRSRIQNIHIFKISTLKMKMVKSAVMFFSIQGSSTWATKEKSIIQHPPHISELWDFLPWPWYRSTRKVIKTRKQQDWESSPLDSDRMQINKWFRHKSWITTYLFLCILFLKAVIWITEKSVFLSRLSSFYTLGWIYSWYHNHFLNSRK